jgi:hypothetical protein
MTIGIYQLEESPRCSDAFPFPGLRVHVATGCHHGGGAFKDIAFVIEPQSGNPLLAVPRPLGFSAVREIMDLVEARKADKRVNASVQCAGRPTPSGGPGRATEEGLVGQDEAGEHQGDDRQRS